MPKIQDSRTQTALRIKIKNPLRRHTEKTMEYEFTLKYQLKEIDSNLDDLVERLGGVRSSRPFRVFLCCLFCIQVHQQLHLAYRRFAHAGHISSSTPIPIKRSMTLKRGKTIQSAKLKFYRADATMR
jgi:hypothetical protein